MDDWIVRVPLEGGDSYLLLWGVPLVIWGWFVIGGLMLMAWFFED
jgi:hypothetical protein